MSDSPNFLTYAQTAFDPFEERPFCAVDSLVFAWLSYLRLPDDMPELEGWRGLDVRELLRAECYRDMVGDLWNPEGSLTLLEAVAASPRYRGVHVCGYRAVSDVVATEQFAAMAFRFPAGFSYLSFRGTDSTIVGWKEDFNMSFLSPVPSQKDAVRYIDTTVQRSEGKLILGGHSKGGNLAVYASVFARPSVKKRIITVYNNDGPGFDSNFVKHPDYLAILPRIKSIVPYCSVVGMLLNHDGDYEVVKSSQSGLMQHDSMSWQVIGPDFETEQDLSPKSKRLNTALSAWIDGLTREQRAEFVDTLFSLVTASGAKNLSEISTVRFKNVNAVLKSFRKLDKSERAMILKIFASLTGEIGKAYKNN